MFCTMEDPKAEKVAIRILEPLTGLARIKKRTFVHLFPDVDPVIWRASFLKATCAGTGFSGSLVGSLYSITEPSKRALAPMDANCRPRLLPLHVFPSQFAAPKQNEHISMTKFVRTPPLHFEPLGIPCRGSRSALISRKPILQSPNARTRS
jgi:hypothetical protein